MKITFSHRKAAQQLQNFLLKYLLPEQGRVMKGKDYSFNRHQICQ
jgi:hypothetical protein